MANTNIYETSHLISQYCEFHYGEDYFDVPNYPKKTIDSLLPFVKETTKALDLGCSVGRSSFELAQYFQHVDAVDYSHRFIDVAQQLQTEQSVEYNMTIEGEIYEKKEIDLTQFDFFTSKNKVSFSQGDASNLNSNLQGYDLIFCSNLIDRLSEPKKFLDDIQNRLNPNGLLVLCSPYTWLHDHTHKNEWFGGYMSEGKPQFTFERLKQELSDFELLHTQDIEFVIRETKRKFQHTISEMSIFQKKS